MAPKDTEVPYLAAQATLLDRVSGHESKFMCYPVTRIVLYAMDRTGRITPQKTFRVADDGYSWVEES